MPDLSNSEETISIEDAQRASVAELVQKLTSSEDGLSAAEAKRRLDLYGPNEITEKRINPLVKFLTYFWGPIPWMIEVAIILSALIQHYEDFLIILALLVLNAVVGFWEENKAANAIELLKRKLAVTARVLRDGAWSELAALQLVPGDIVRVRLGDVVPADVKLTKGAYLLLDESGLTGESLPVEKHASDVAYSGSVVHQGEMDALAIATGMSTYFGKTARLVGEAKTVSHFQKAVIRIGDYLIAIAIALAALIIAVALIRQESLLEILQFALVLTVAAIPVALPAVLSVTMAVGALALAKKEAIVSKLVAIEEMAGVDILCADKTGTITKNELTLADVRPLKGFTNADVLLFASLASRAEDRDPIDAAILTKATEEGAFDAASSAYKLAEFTPFDPVSKRTEAIVEKAGSSRFKVSKGAPQAILALTSQESERDKVNDLVNAFAQKGYRALGVASTNAKDEWHDVGIIALYDPPREDSAETIESAQSMGVDIKMVTGDHAAIAREIASEVHLGTEIVEATSFTDKSGEDAEDLVESADGFAQVFPEHKYRIVELLQKRGHIVGMTGDGVNDAPALKKADAGVAVAGATDAAKSAADIVLTNPGLSVIIDSIKESRRIFQRMTSYGIYRIGETLRVLLFITLSILIFNFYPVTAIMIVLLALLNDGAILTIAYDRAQYRNTPEVWDMRTVLSVATLLGLLGVTASFSLFYFADRVFFLSRLVIQSMMYLKLSVAGHFMIFVARARGPFWSFPHPARILVAAVLGTQFVATLIVVYGLFMAPIGWALALAVWGYALVWFLIADSLKVLFYKYVLKPSSKLGAALGYIPGRI